MYWTRVCSCLTVLMVAYLCAGLASCNSVAQKGVESPIVAVETASLLINATLVGDVDRVRLLLEQGTDPNLVHNTNTALTYAARDGFAEIARLLVEYGADVNWIDGEGVTPLILASFKDHIEIVQLLLDHGADRGIKDQWNRTALDYALRRGETDAIAQLLRAAD